MARARNIKPGAFKNEILLEMEPVTRLLFIGLWTLADREGRIEDRPKRIKLELLPFDDVNVDGMLDQLADGGFINRYEANGVKVVEVCNFLKHQNPHGTEKDSELPDINGELTVHERGKNGCVTGNKRAVNVKNNKNNVKPTLDNSGLTVNPPLDNALNPESLILNPDSLNPDSGILKPESKNKEVAQPSALREPETAKDETALQAACKQTWESYCIAYKVRYKVDPVRNAKVNAQVKQLCKSLPLDEAPQVAEFYVFHNQEFYVRKGHDFGLLVSDATKLRTEWATGQMMTGTRAKQVDRTSSMLDAAEQVKREMGWTA
ncbi:hypothetical protein [Limnobacter sp.]|uniref:hypothetical protein n=1 Tax=Limnobacter sp. TaxID=2003368 RepID=UPI002735931A|nr:hypothetical protein [Limnobacter sp.]MDP3273423.1 hypothetical protein [Limnobacter sp.]